jgi:xanthine dehydrogenase molybdopterin-binding subunit B
MSKQIDDSIEVERYELFAEPAYQFNFELERRDFFKLLGGGLVLVFTLDAFASQESGRQAGESGRRSDGNSLPKEIGGWLHIGEGGAITAYTGKVEFGQNIRTSLSQVVAEELRVPVGSVRFIMGDTDLTPFDMGTFGSRTSPTMAPQLRKAAAAAREALIDLAAEQWKVDRATLAVKEGKVVNEASKQAIDFGKLSKGQKLVKVIADNVPTTPADQWKITGKSLTKVDGRAFVTGKHRYTSDTRLPEMLFGKVVRPSAFDASIVSVDTREAEAMPGVKVVRDGGFIGVAAPSAEAASKAAAAIKVEWKSEPQPSGKELFDYLRKQSAESPRANVTGSVADGFAQAHQRIQQTYTVAYIAHAPLDGIRASSL